MPTPRQDSAALRRQLRNELREARTRAKLTQKQVADRLEWSPSKIIRIESGQVAISAVDLRAMLAEYGVDDKSKVEQLLEVSRSSKKSPWDEYRDVLQGPSVDYLGYESSAVIVRQFEPALIPGLLQTEAYSRAVLAAAGNTPTQVERLVEARRVRQELLDNPGHGELFFIMDEAAIRRQVGGAEVMAEQLEKLILLADRDDLTVQIVPFEAGVYNGVFGSFIHLEFSNEDSVLYMESRVETIFKENESEVAKYLDLFQEIEAIATTEEEFKRIANQAIGTLTHQSGP
jgi:transcriptional regulator with XRE-family HTH domain